MLYGMPQNQKTGQLGKELILAALNREDIFKGRNISVDAVPISADTIRFDIRIQSTSGQPVTLSIKQNLGA
jgi:trehalose-6-phosphate synthase